VILGLISAAVCHPLDVDDLISSSSGRIAIPNNVLPGYPVTKYEYTGQVFRLMPSDFADHFAVAKDGLLMTTTTLNDVGRNGTASGTLTIVEEHPQFSKIAVTEVIVLAPESMLKFRRHGYDGSVAENSAPGSPVEFDDVTCLVGHVSRSVKLSLTSCQDDFALQSMYPTDGCFLLLTKRRFDAEHDKRKFTCYVQAADKTTGERVIAKLKIKIRDVNDHAPVFTDEYVNISLPFPTEGRHVIGVVKAVDGDGDKVVYQQRQYHTNIVVVPQTGEVVLAEHPESVLDTFTTVVDAIDKRPNPEPRLKSEAPAVVYVSFYLPSDEAKIVEGNDEELSNYVGVDRIERSFLLDRADDLFRFRAKRQSSALRPTKKLEYKETDGAVEGQVVFQLDKDSDREIFKIRDTSNVWVTVDPDGKVRVKKKWDYEELGPEKDINIWVEITNPNSPTGGKSNLPKRSSLYIILFSSNFDLDENKS
jgi:hypothetical protein